VSIRNARWNCNAITGVNTWKVNVNIAWSVIFVQKMSPLPQFCKNKASTFANSLNNPARGVGSGGLGVGAGWPGPPSFAKCPFSGSKVPFSCVKNVIKITFLAQRALLKTWIYVICGKLFSFPGKYHISGKFFFIFRKKCDISRKFFLVCP
jgi:hypothetical protein